ncbi:MAG: PIN domain-containing protein [Chloroflexi bacterium]|nr:PIN domain-containing protein [Chloroflexota bacterium]
MLLLDTDVMIDLMRRYHPALAWLQEAAVVPIALPGLVAMELIQGCRRRDEQQRIENGLRQYPLYWPTQTDCARALADFSNFRLSNGLGLLDALIAETAIGLDVPLVTFNEKHYRIISNLQTIQPYNRL